MQQQRWLVGNWKMHGGGDFVRNWFRAFRLPAGSGESPLPCRLVICPPFPYLSLARANAPEYCGVGVQNIALSPDAGAYTGEVSAAMVHECGGELAIIGHSERRYAIAAETDDECADKIKNAVAAGLHAVLCVGENLSIRESGGAIDFVVSQLSAVCGALSDLEQWKKLIIAYEPVWAIGSGLTPTAEDIVTMHGALRRYLIGQAPDFGGTIPILYGGSVSPDNAAVFGKLAEVAGFLVGGASLNSAVFSDIYAIMERECA